jgi:hypothetical protein
MPLNLLFFVGIPHLNSIPRVDFGIRTENSEHTAGIHTENSEHTAVDLDLISENY